MNVGVIGTCLSNLTAVHLQQDYGWDRINNAAVTKSDLFLSQIIDGKSPPARECLEKIFGIDPKEQIFGERLLREQFRDTAGMTEIDPGRPCLWQNLANKVFDVLLLDNLSDTIYNTMWYEDSEFGLFPFFMPLHLGSKAEKVLSNVRVDPFLTPDQSADNWIRIIRYFLSTQPQARIFFVSAQYATCIGDPARYDRALLFHGALIKRAADLPIEIIPPIVVPPELTKLPDDRDHFDMSVYRALAGHIFMTVTAGWSNWTNRALPDDVRFAEVDHNARVIVEPVPLRRSDRQLNEVVAKALGISREKIHETSGEGVTENWDSLKQIGLMTAVESAFGVKFPTRVMTDARSIGLIRQALGEAGVTAADHPPSTVPPDISAREVSASRKTREIMQLPPDLPRIDWARARDERRNLFAAFAERALAAPEAPFALFVSNGDERILTQGGMLASAARIAHELGALERGAIVAIVLDHSPYIYAAFLGCVMSGLVPTVLPPMTPRQDPVVFRDAMKVLFDRIEPSAVVTSSRVEAGVPATAALRVLTDDLQPLHANAETFAAAAMAFRDGGDVAFLQHSSGTTGHKKGVMLTHLQVLEQARVYSQSIDLQPGCRIASWLPLYHDMGLLTSFIIPAIIGAPVISLDALEWVARPTMLLDYIEKEQAHYCWLPNFSFLHIVRNDAGERAWDLHSLRMFVSCSEPCRAAAFDAFVKRYETMGVGREKLQASYAMAENVFAVTQTPSGSPVRVGDGPAAGYLSSGIPLPGAEVQIRTSDGIVLFDGEIGEICIRSTSLFSGYFAFPELTSERMEYGWYHTRDIGLLNDNELWVVGRVDDVLIVNGRNMIAHEIEDDLSLIEVLAPGRILAAGEFDENIGTDRLLILAELADGIDPSEEIERRIYASVFSSCGVMPKVRLVERGYLIKSTSGKLARARSLEKYRSGANGG